MEKCEKSDIIKNFHIFFNKQEKMCKINRRLQLKKQFNSSKIMIQLCGYSRSDQKKKKHFLNLGKKTQKIIF